MESTSSSHQEVMLGFLSEPKNSLITTAKYLPSKVGGKPVRFEPLKNLIRLEWKIKNVSIVDLRCHSCFNCIAIWTRKSIMNMKD